MPIFCKLVAMARPIHLNGQTVAMQSMFKLLTPPQLEVLMHHPFGKPSPSDSYPVPYGYVNPTARLNIQPISTHGQAFPSLATSERADYLAFSIKTIPGKDGAVRPIPYGDNFLLREGTYFVIGADPLDHSRPSINHLLVPAIKISPRSRYTVDVPGPWSIVSRETGWQRSSGSATWVKDLCYSKVWPFEASQSAQMFNKWLLNMARHFLPEHTRSENADPELQNPNNLAAFLEVRLQYIESALAQ